MTVPEAVAYGLTAIVYLLGGLAAGAGAVAIFRRPR